MPAATPRRRPARRQPGPPKEPNLTETQKAIQEYNRRWQASAEAARPGLERQSFRVTDAIHITDPCYAPGTWCGQFGLPALPGDWVGTVQTADMGDWGVRNAVLVVHHCEHPPAAEADWQPLDGPIGVDSGQAGVFAAELYEHDEKADPSSNENFYGRACTMTLTPPGHGCFEQGYVTRSGLGDGAYPAEVLRMDGRVTAVRIRFLDDRELAG